MSDQLRCSVRVHEVLSMGPKHPRRDKFNETHFFADIEIFLPKIKKHLLKLYVK